MTKKAKGKFIWIWGLLLLFLLAVAFFVFLKVNAFIFALIITGIVPVYVAPFLFLFSTEIDFFEKDLRNKDIKPYDIFPCG